MMARWKTFTTAAAAVAAAAAATVLTGPSAVAGQQGGAGPRHDPPVLPITLTQNGFSVPGPDPRLAGPVTFDVTAAAGPTGHWWTVDTLRNGVTLAQATQDLDESYSSDPSVALPALRAFYSDMTFYGGLSIDPASHMSLTETLDPGGYYLSDETATTGATPPATLGQAQLQVTAPYAAAQMPLPDGLIDAQLSQGHQIFAAPADLPARGRVLLSNHTDQPQEFIFVQVQPGTSDQQIQAYFNAEVSGQTLPPDPFLATAGGMLAISPGRQAELGFAFRPGRYAVLSFVRDAQTGTENALEGMHRIITLTGVPGT
jgi:hypothetical protein